MNSYQFKYKGKTYECRGEDKDLQIRNFNHCIEIRDWSTMKNRIKNQLKWSPDDLVEITEIKLEDIFNDTKMEKIKNFIDEHKKENNNNKFW